MKSKIRSIAYLLALGAALSSASAVHGQNNNQDPFHKRLLKPPQAETISGPMTPQAGEPLVKGHVYTFLTTDFPGANVSEAFGFADGITVGLFGFASFENQSFTFQSSKYEVFSVPGAATTLAMAINDNGQIAGGYVAGSPPVAHCFIDKAGSFTTIDYPGSGGTLCIDINLAGHVAGVYYDAADNPHGFTYDGSTFTPIDFPGGSQTIANGINSAGEVVGSFVDAANVGHGFTYIEGVYATLDPPGSTYTAAFGINDPGVISGVYNDSDFVTHGFLYSEGTFTTVDVQGASGTSLNHVNNKNQFAGSFYDESGEGHAITGH